MLPTRTWASWPSTDLNVGHSDGWSQRTDQRPAQGE